MWNKDLITPDDAIGKISFLFKDYFVSEKLVDITSGRSVTIDVKIDVINRGPDTLKFSMVYTSL